MTSPDSNPNLRPVSPIKWLLIAIALAASGLAGWAVQRTRHPTKTPPSVDLSSAQDLVAEAITSDRQQVLDEPHSADAWGELGMTLFANELSAEANECFEEASRLAPQDYRWPYLRGLNTAVSDPEAAAKHFRHAIAIRPKHVVARQRLAELLLHLEQWDEARVQLEEALRLDPNHVRSFLLMARWSATQGQLEVALEWAQRAAKAAPDVRDVHEWLARLHQQLGHRKAAVKELRLVEELSGAQLEWDDPLAAEVLALRRDLRWSLRQAEELMAIGNPQEAVRVLQSALNRDNRDPQGFCLLAQALLRLGKLSDADEWLVRGEQRHPKSSEIRFTRGVVQFFGEAWEQAEASFRQAIELKPDYALAYYNLGHVLLKRGEQSAAECAFGDAVRLRPHYADAHMSLGRLLLDRGDSERAAVHFRTALQLKPADPEARRLLERSVQK